jgi:exosome complex component RRP40
MLQPLKINMATTATIVLPGDEVPTELLPNPTNKKKTLKLGPGLRHIPPSTIKASIAGALATDSKKNAAWIDFNSGRVSLMHAPLKFISITSFYLPE